MQGSDSLGNLFPLSLIPPHNNSALGKMVVGFIACGHFLFGIEF
jgi:hypothetical protein